ncbi:hypothetical protein MTX78_11225 [Hymenobacter tibetensis]|uniref:TonB-dependent receptor n=1 Tax=Hymenobacter tibetensis TaxID=497967 RepID=A0ABY4D3P1_9BACT|nr:hypothetical protein [Hymenobacter tibetensis]UOG77149.1 hypothetical protein MTX78_11225 [Hymenobacter tibetensis]
MTFHPSKLLALAGLLAAAPAAVQAQTTRPNTRGKIEEAEIEIVKERVNQLPEAARNFEKIKIDPPAKTASKVGYTYPDFRLPADLLNPSVRVLTIRQEEPAPQTGNYLKAGVGNYGTFLGRAHLHNTRSNSASYGLDLNHLASARGPIDKKNSGQSRTSLDLHGETYSGATALGAKVELGRERYNFYGYNRDVAMLPEADNLKQTFTRAGVKVYARNQAPETTFQYDLGVGFRHWNDRFEAKENNLYATLRSAYVLGEKGRVSINGDLSFISFEDSLKYNRPYFQITPAYEATLNRLAVTVGATIGYTGDTIRQAQQFNVYPAVRVGYTVTEDKFVVYGGLGGGVERVTMYDLTTENPWLAPNQRVADTRRGPTVYFGFNAAPARALEVNARLTLSNDRNLYFYNNSRRDSTKFDLVYDKKATQLVNIHGEIIYNAAEKTRIGLKADYNGYNVKTLAEAFHRPAFQSVLFATHNVYDKLLLGAELYTYSSSFGSSFRRPVGGPFQPQREVVRPTDSVVDLNLRGDYRIKENLSIFAMGNNLLGRKYERFLNYPVKGINVLAGVTYDF